VTASPNPSVAGQPVTFTAMVSPTTPGGPPPTGTVTFLEGGNPIGSATLGSNGQAALTIATLSVGSHTITASYPGDGNFNPSSGSVTQLVNKNGTTTLVLSSANPSTLGQSVTFTAVLSPVTPIGSTPVPSGMVTFFADGNSIGTGTLGANGQATVSTAALTVGSHIITTTYGGDINFNGSNGTLNANQQVINAIGGTATTTTLMSSQNPSSIGQSVTFTATVSGSGGTPTGTVTFSVDGAAGTPIALSGGQALFTTSTLPLGNHNITAAYGGDTNFAASTTAAPLVQMVNKRPTTTTVVSSANPSNIGQSVTFTATVTGSGGLTPMGTVTFSVDGVAGAPVNLTNASASFSTAVLTTGPHKITATYNSDANFTASTSAILTQNVNTIATSTTVTSSVNPSAPNQSVTFTATVTGGGGGLTPMGTVTFSVDGIAGAPVNLTNASASFSTATLTLGTHKIVATYNGDANFGGSTSAELVQNVQNKPTTTTVTSSANPSAPGQSVTFTATVSGSNGSLKPSGTLTFSVDGSALPAVNLINGQASFSTAALTTGSHTIIATFTPDIGFAASTSAPLIQRVGPPADSTRLRELQISATPIIAQGWAQAVTAAMADATAAGFGGNPQSLAPAGTGFTYYFNDDPPARPQTASDEDSLRRFLAAPNGNAKRVDDDFRALGYTGGMPTKAPPPPASSAAPRDWLAWISVRGTDFYRGTFGNDLKGVQVDAFAGLTRRITSNLVVGVLGGYEHFDYSSQAFNGVLKGDGWTAGAFLGWKLSANMRFDAGAAWSDLVANPVSGTASGSFLGTRWLVQGGLTGTYPWQSFVLEPSARVFALWEHENAFTDSLGTQQAARNFETGRASAGIKAVYPLAWTSSVALAPYAGLYADYYFSRDDAQTPGLTTVPLLQGWSARLTSGVTATLPGGASLGAGGELGGIGSANHIWTWTVRGRLPF
jgi:nitrogen fixation protein FixH